MFDFSKMKVYVEKSGLKQKAIAQKSGVSEVALSQILNGKRKATVDDYANICNAMGAKFDDFIILETDTPPT